MGVVEQKPVIGSGPIRTEAQISNSTKILPVGPN